MAVLATARLKVGLVKMAEWRVACDGATLAWQRRGWTSSETGELPLASTDPAILPAAIQEAFAGRPHRSDSLRLALSSHHIRVAALNWPVGRLSAEEQKALLYQRWRERLDEVDDFWLGIEGAGSVRLATAMRQDLLQHLLDAAAGWGIRPRACLPIAALALRHAVRTPDIRIQLDEGSRQTVMSITGGRLAGLKSGWRSVPSPGSYGPASFGDAIGTSPDESAGEPTRASRAGQAIRLEGGPRSWLDWF